MDIANELAARPGVWQEQDQGELSEGRALFRASVRHIKSTNLLEVVCHPEKVGIPDDHRRLSLNNGDPSMGAFAA